MLSMTRKKLCLGSALQHVQRTFERARLRLHATQEDLKKKKTDAYEKAIEKQEI